MTPSTKRLFYQHEFRGQHHASPSQYQGHHHGWRLRHQRHHGRRHSDRSTLQHFRSEQYRFYFFATSGRAELIVSDTEINNNGFGIYINPSSGVIVSAMLDRVQITTTGITTGDPALWLTGSGTIAGSLRQSVVAGNASIGILADATGGVYFTVEESSVIDNVGEGIGSAAPGVNIGVGGSTFGGNGTAVVASGGGSLVSFGNNQFSANGSDGNFTGTKALK